MSGKIELRDALAKHGQRLVEKHKGSHWATVIDTSPLTLDVHDYDHNLFEGDDFTVSQTLSAYRQSVGLYNDDLLLLHAVGDAWVAVDVVSDRKVPPIGGGAPGPPGPQGPPGTDTVSIEDATYVYTQVTAAVTWNVVHNLGKYPSVMVVDSGNSVVIPDVRYFDVNSLSVTFGSATSGKAYMN
jgi:hypothetical protein